MQDPIADMLTRIRNAQAVGEKTILMPASNIKAAMLQVLLEEGYILGFEEQLVENIKHLAVSLKYYQGRPVIEKIKRISKPGLRIYKHHNNLPTIRAGMGVAIISTSKGVMTERNARRQKVGGEVLCSVE